MATLAFTHTFVSGTLAKSSEVNQNFTDVLSWSTNLQEDNIGTLAGPIEWAISSGSLALDINNAGAEGSIDIAQTVALNASKASVKVVHSGNDNASSLGAFYGQMTNASNAQPIFHAQSTHAGPSFKATLDGSEVRGFLIRKGGNDAYMRHSGTKGGLGFGVTTLLEWDASFLYFPFPTVFGNITVQSDGSNFWPQAPIKVQASDGPILSRSAAQTLNVANNLNVVTNATIGSLATAAEVRAPIVRASSKLDFDDATKLYYEHTTSAPSYASGVHRVLQKNYSSSLVQTPITVRLSDDGLGTITGDGSISWRVNASQVSMIWDLDADSINAGIAKGITISFSPNLNTSPVIQMTLETNNSDARSLLKPYINTINNTQAAVGLINVSGLYGLGSQNIAGGVLKRVHLTMTFQENGNS